MKSTVALVLVAMFGMAALALAAESTLESLVSPGLATATIERTLTYQGLLKNASGDPVPDAAYNITFRLYENAAGGTALWNSGALAVTTVDGYFTRELGPIPLNFDRPYYLSLQVSPDAEMTQRQKVTMTPYSAVSDTANYAFAAPGGGGNWTLSGNLLSTSAYYGVAKGGAGNVHYGDSTRSMVNWGVACTTGTSGYHYVNTVVGGGRGNKAGANFATIGGGYGNRATAFYSTVGGGDLNHASAMFSTVGGGIGDTSNGAASGVFSGYGNIAGDAAEDTGAFIGGGSFNRVGGKYSTVAGGVNNHVSADGGVICGGKLNMMIGSNSIIGSGDHNFCSGGGGVIGGGSYDTVSADEAVVVGGYNNTASGYQAVVVGGFQNEASGEESFVGCGYGNRATGFYSTICGGLYNRAAGDYSFIGHGNEAYTNGDNSVVFGVSDTIGTNGNFSFVFGNQVYINNDYRVAFFDSLHDGNLNINRDERDGISNTYPIHVGGQTDDGNGAYLTAGGTWTNGSSRTFKENFIPYDGAELLSKISGLSLTSYNFINSTEKHFGPVAEEFVGAFDTGVIRESDGKRDDMYLSSGDVAGVALAGVQELIEQNKVLLEKIDRLEKRIEDLENR